MYDDIIESAAKQYSVDPNLIRAIIAVESSWNPNATRYEPTLRDSSYGLMQVLLSTARRVSGNSGLTAQQLLDPTVNILVGTAYLRELMGRYPTNLDDVIAAYNAGTPTRSIIPGRTYTNQDYVNKVRSYYGGGSYAQYLGPLALGFLVVGAIISRR